MRQRQQPAYRRRRAPTHLPGAGPRKRFAIPALLLVAAVIGALALGTNALIARAGEEATPGEQKQGRTAAATTDASGSRGSDTERVAPRSHVTFGAHTSATQACETCHPDASTGEIACRSCHGDTCGKDSKTVADCLACHKTGTTDRWVVDEP